MIVLRKSKIKAIICLMLTLLVFLNVCGCKENKNIKESNSININIETIEKKFKEIYPIISELPLYSISSNDNVYHYRMEHDSSITFDKYSDRIEYHNNKENIHIFVGCGGGFEISKNEKVIVELITGNKVFPLLNLCSSMISLIERLEIYNGELPAYDVVEDKMVVTEVEKDERYKHTYKTYEYSPNGKIEFVYKEKLIENEFYNGHLYCYIF